MIENDALKYFIHEELFLLKEETVQITKSLEKESPMKPEEIIVAETEEIKKTHHDLVILLEKNQTIADKEMLQKMIPAISKNYSETKFILQDQWNSVSFNFLIVFGEFSMLKGLPALDLNESKQIDKKKIIQTVSIEKLHTDIHAKGLFWKGLKKMFDV